MRKHVICDSLVLIQACAYFASAHMHAHIYYIETIIFSVYRA